MPSASPSPPLITRERLVVAGLLVFTVVVRGSVLWAMRGNLEQDPDAYREIAENILAHGVYGLGKEGQPAPTAYRPPLYPIVLSNLPASDGKHVSLVKVGVLHVLLGVATVWLTYLTARKCSPTLPRKSPGNREYGRSGEIFMGRGDRPSWRLRVGHELAQPGPSANDPNQPTPRLFRFLAHTECGPTLAALLVACDPILLNQQTLVMTETLATFLAILVLWCLARVAGTLRVPSAPNGTRSVPTTGWWNAGLVGGAIGLAALCRPTFLPWLGLVGGVETVVHVGPGPNLLPATFRRLSNNIEAQLNRPGLGSFGRRTLARLVRRP
ncbi:MAG: hypothetical protein L0211_01420, partial [Planctomycetaceae bacterium]|nr:hypothetical protein [Planctomycetaceae bacterium]